MNTSDSVIVRFGADTSELVNKLHELPGIVKGRFDEMGSAISGIAAKFAGIAAAVGASLSVAGLVNLTKRSIDAADRLNDLSQQTGIAVDIIGGLGFAASQAGGSLESMAAAAGKLNRTLAAGAAGDAEALAPFKAIGIEVTDAAGKTKAADKVFAEIADKFATYKDGPEKAALAIKIFGRAGADIIPMLNEGGQALLDNVEYYKRFGGTADDVAKKADAFNDTLSKLDLISGAFGRTMAAELLPPLQAVADGLLRAKENSDLFKTVASAIRTVFETLSVVGANVTYVLAGVGREIGAIAAQIAALARGDLEGFRAISDAVKADGVRARAELDALERRILGLPQIDAAGGGRGSVNPANVVPDKADAPRVGQPAAAGGDDRLRAAHLALERANAEASLSLEKEYLAQAQAIYDDAFKNNLISTEQYFDAKLAVELRGIDASLEARRKEADAAANAKKVAENLAVAAKPEDRSKLQAQALQFKAQEVKLLGEISVLEAQRIEAARKQGEASKEAARKLADDLNAIRAGREKAAADNEIETARKIIEQKVQLREIDAETAFEAQKALEQRSYEAMLAALEAKRAAVRGSDAEILKAKAELDAEKEAAEQQHQQRMTSIDQAAELERKRFSLQAQQSVQGSFQTMVADLLNGVTKVSDVFRKFAQSVANTFVNLIAQKFTDKLFNAAGVGKAIDSMVTVLTQGISTMVAKWLGFETAKSSASAGGAAMREGIEEASSIKSIALWAMTAVKNIAAAAWQAAASVYAAIAAIPFVGPFLAPAAAIAAGAVVLGFAGRIASSEGGEYRVDQDRLNIVHKDETILPAPFAEGLRQLVGKGGVTPVVAAIDQIVETLAPDARQVRAATGSDPAPSPATQPVAALASAAPEKSLSGDPGALAMVGEPAAPPGQPVPADASTSLARDLPPAPVARAEPLDVASPARPVPADASAPPIEREADSGQTALPLANPAPAVPVPADAAVSLARGTPPAPEAKAGQDAASPGIARAAPAASVPPEAAAEQTAHAARAEGTPPQVASAAPMPTAAPLAAPAPAAIPVPADAATSLVLAPPKQGETALPPAERAASVSAPGQPTSGPAERETAKALAAGELLPTKVTGLKPPEVPQTGTPTTTPAQDVGKLVMNWQAEEERRDKPLTESKMAMSRLQDVTAGQSVERPWWRVPRSSISRIQSQATEAAGPGGGAPGNAQGGGPAAAPVQLVGASAGDFFIANRKHLLKVLSDAGRDLRKPSS